MTKPKYETNLDELRQTAGFKTGGELARKAGVSPGQYSRLAAGHSLPMGPTLMALAKVLGVDPSSITFKAAKGGKATKKR